MDLKESFLASLSDEQLGFFCAHEYNENLADMLQDEINVIQYQLFVKWQEDEKKNATHTPVQSSSQPDFTDNMSPLLEMFAERIEAKIEQKIKALEESYSEKLANIEIKIEQSGQQIEKLEESYSVKLASIEQQIVQAAASQQQQSDKLVELEGSITQQFGCIKQKFEESEPHLTEKSDQLAEKVFDCIAKSSDWNILNEKVDDIYYNTFMIPTMTVEEAKKWFEKIKQELVNKRYECITENTVKKSIGIMKKFQNNEYIVVRGTDTLERMTRRSDMTVLYIRNTPGAIEYLMKLFKNNDYRNSDFFFILIRIVESKETQKHLMKSEYLSLIFEQLSNDQNTYYILLSSQILACLLDFSEDYFPVNLTKNMIESKIIKRLPLVFPLGVFDSAALPRDYSWCLERLTNGSKAQKYVCATVVVCASEYSGRQLIDAGAIPILKRVSSDANTDSLVKKEVDMTLQNLKK